MDGLPLRGEGITDIEHRRSSWAIRREWVRERAELELDEGERCWAGSGPVQDHHRSAKAGGRGARVAGPRSPSRIRCP